jgi:hypothetical protein
MFSTAHFLDHWPRVCRHTAVYAMLLRRTECAVLKAEHAPMGRERHD